MDSEKPYITNEYKNSFELNKIDYGTDINIINVNSVRQAKRLLDYFNMHRLILTGYEIDPKGDFDNEIFLYLSNKISTNIMGSNNEQKQILRRLLLWPGNIVNSSHFNQKYRNKPEEISQCLDILKSSGLGNTKSIRNGTRYVTIFEKIDLKKAENNFHLIRSLNNFGITPANYEKFFAMGTYEKNSYTTFLQFI